MPKTFTKLGFFEKFLGSSISEKENVLNIRALELIEITTKLPKKTFLWGF